MMQMYDYFFRKVCSGQNILQKVPFARAKVCVQNPLAEFLADLSICLLTLPTRSLIKTSGICTASIHIN